jgi:DNA-binding transcriptional LysR family regulator
MLDSRRLEVFHAVASTRSFSAAGDRVGLTQPGVSRQVAALEREIGKQLFDRSGRSVHLTAAGELLFDHAQAVLGRLALAERDLARLAAGEIGSLRIAAHPSAAVSLMPEAVGEFTRQRPDVELSLIESDSNDSPDELRAGQIDLAVVSVDDGRSHQAEDDLAHHHLLDDEWLLVLPADHQLAHVRRLTIAQLAGQRMIESKSTAGAIAALSARVGTEPQGRFQCEEWLGRQGLVAAGVGVAVIPRLALAAVRPDLVVRPLGGAIPPRHVYALHRRAAVNDPLVSAMVDELRRAAARLQLPQPGHDRSMRTNRGPGEHIC